MISTISFVTETDLRLPRYECASTFLIPAPSQMTSTAASDIARIFVRLANQMGTAIPCGIRCLLIVFFHASSNATASTPWTHSSISSWRQLR